MKALVSRLFRASLLVACLAFAWVEVAIAEGLEFSAEDTVVVTASRAWEADEVDVVHFTGDFLMRAPDWAIKGERAVVYGKLDDPERVVVEGNPARVSFLREDDDDPDALDEAERIDGSAAVVEYFRSTDKLSMRGDASLTRKDSSLASESIDYDVESDRYSAGGQGGINILYNVEDD